MVVEDVEGGGGGDGRMVGTARPDKCPVRTAVAAEAVPYERERGMITETGET